MSHRTTRAASALGALLLAGLVLATPVLAELTPAENRCQVKASKVMARFGKRVVQCIMRCQRDARAGRAPSTDCYAPYGGRTAACLADPARGAQPRAVTAFRRACDPTVTPSADCPECYADGDCNTYAEDHVAYVQGQLDSLAPGVYCDPGTVVARARCMDGVATGLTTMVTKLHRCYDACIASERRGSLAPGVCAPPASDPATVSCIAGAESKAIASIDAACAPPRGEGPPCDGNGYPSGSTWAYLLDAGASGNVPAKYCDDGP